jgi:hypothetical protein
VHVCFSDVSEVVVDQRYGLCMMNVLLLAACKEDEFTCANKYCIPKSNRCNDFNNCQDGSDEQNCHMHPDLNMLHNILMPIIRGKFCMFLSEM